MSIISEFKDKMLFEFYYRKLRNRCVFSHHGIQRSGTNYVNEVLKIAGVGIINSNDPQRNNPCHKHFRWQHDKSSIVLDGNYQNQLIANDISDVNSFCGYNQYMRHLVIYRDPESWLPSIYSWGCESGWVREGESVNDFMVRALEEWVAYYSFWSDVSCDSSVLIVKYEDFKNKESYMMNILCNFLGQKIDERCFNIKAVPRSPKGIQKYSPDISKISNEIVIDFYNRKKFDSINFMKMG